MAAQRPRWLPCLLVTLLSLAATPGLAAQPNSRSLLPSSDNPKLRFGTGLAQHNQPQIDPRDPPIPGPRSAWFVAQWNQSSVMTPDRMTRHDPATADPALGTAAYGFSAPDGHSHLWIYQPGPHGHPVYALFERDGTLRPGGGANLFLSADLIRPVSFAHQIMFSMRAKVSAASISYQTPTAETSGAVLGMAFIGFGINFPNPENRRPSTLFLQVSLTNTRPDAALKDLCRLSDAGNAIVIMGGTLSGRLPLAFRPAAGPLRRISVLLNDYIAQFRRRGLACRSASGMRRIRTADLSPAQITLTSIYIGLETENVDARPAAARAAAQGQVALGLQISDMQLLEQAGG